MEIRRDAAESCDGRSFPQHRLEFDILKLLKKTTSLLPPAADQSKLIPRHISTSEAE